MSTTTLYHAISNIRTRFFIHLIRMYVSGSLRTCATCKQSNNIPYLCPNVPPLSSERRQRPRPSRVWHSIILACKGTNSRKEWICLITCMTARPVHLEVVLDNMTHNTIQLQISLAFRRIIARRGASDIIYSENSTTLQAEETAKTTFPIPLPPGVRFPPFTLFTKPSGSL